MKNLFLILLLLATTSCEIFLSPPMIELEEKIAEDIVDDVEEELDKVSAAIVSAE